MKISPVVGIPTIPNTPSTGLSPDKIERIKQIAQNLKPEPTKEVVPQEKEVVQLGETPTSATQRIKMNVNRSTTRPIEQATEEKTQENAPLAAEEPKADPQAQVVNSDTSVQATEPQAQPSAQPKTEVIGAVSPELAQLAKERRAVQLEREQLEKQKQELQGKTAEELIKKLQSSPLSVLQEYGVTYEQLTNEILGQSQQPQIDPQKITDEIIKKVDERLSAKDTQQEESVYNYMKQNVDKMCYSSDTYKLIRETKSQDKVMDLVKRMWREEGEILDETEAMDLIEAELKEEARRYAKLIGVTEPTEPQEEIPQDDAVKVAPPKAKTLTNKDSARPLMNRRQRAIAAALGQK